MSIVAGYTLTDMKWGDPGMPSTGWVCVGVADNGPIESQRHPEHCTMCARAPQLRYVHTLEHDGRRLRKEVVGVECAGHMEGASVMVYNAQGKLVPYDKKIIKNGFGVYERAEAKIRKREQQQREKEEADKRLAASRKRDVELRRIAAIADRLPKFIRTKTGNELTYVGKYIGMVGNRSGRVWAGWKLNNGSGGFNFISGQNFTTVNQAKEFIYNFLNTLR